MDTQADAFQIATAVILPAICGHGLPHGYHSLSENVLELSGSCVGSHCLRAKEVDRRLHDHSSGCGDSKLECHGNTGSQLGLCVLR